MSRIHSVLLSVAFSLALAASVARSAEPIPHNQDAPPGPALTPEEAIQKMTVPEGFSVEVVASEPDIVNPVAMTFDERGRVWITESLEYPRREPGPGRDRIKILEDTDGDGWMDKFTIFAEGLNIPSGIAVGWGGVWVANSPDILFMQDTDGDDRADTSEVVVTGFGRDDTHELPNSLTWGPDGWLYGLNGVFNPASVRQGDKVFDFTCALFRIHPRTREFQLFSEGTSNPWGVAWDNEGSAFISACVIDHLWYLAERGYYHRQGGPYPPFTWKLGSIVEHKHQKAAYCGIHYFDSDAYPVEYRERLYMGNIHGNCINSDILERDGATYFARPAPDFLSANDSWFMPVVQKTAPDGCLYILDWYDRYHCYQDANRDPEGIDRLKGRLYRVRYGETPRAPKFDLKQESDKQLIARLGSPNVYYRDIAQRLLAERNDAATRETLQVIVLDTTANRKARMHALWALIGGGPLNSEFHGKLLKHEDGAFRAWGVRAAGNMGQAEPGIQEAINAAVEDGDSTVRLQAAVAIPKLHLSGDQVVVALTRIAAGSQGDKILPQIAWRSLEPLMDQHAEAFLSQLRQPEIRRSAGISAMMPYIVDRLLDGSSGDYEAVAGLFSLLVEDGETQAAKRCLTTLTERIVNGEIDGANLNLLKVTLKQGVNAVLSTDQRDQGLIIEAVLLAAAWGEPNGLEAARKLLASSGDERVRLRALGVMTTASDPSLVPFAIQLSSDPSSGPKDFRAEVLSALARLDDPSVPTAVLAAIPQLEPELQARAADLLTARTNWANALLDTIESGALPTSVLNETQVRKLLLGGDSELTARLEKIWGTLRTERDPKREEVIARMKVLLRHESGDPHRGQAVFAKLCGQCHKIHGEGIEVGPDITVNGRGSFEQLLSNVFDPSLVIGAVYQARTVVTTDGRVISGLLAEDSPQRIVLKTQGGKLETIPRDQVDEHIVSPLSLMPEGIEDQHSRQEIADLMAYLLLDRPPSDPDARRMSGLFEVQPREAESDEEAARIVSEVAPGFAISEIGDHGLRLLGEHAGRKVVLETHPIQQETPCELHADLNLPADKKSKLFLSVARHPEGDWRLVVKVNGETLHDEMIDERSANGGWHEVNVDLSRFAGQVIHVELENAANDWNYEYGYWGRVELVSE